MQGVGHFSCLRWAATNRCMVSRVIGTGFTHFQTMFFVSEDWACKEGETIIILSSNCDVAMLTSIARFFALQLDVCNALVRRSDHRGFARKVESSFVGT